MTQSSQTVALLLALAPALGMGGAACAREERASLPERIDEALARGTAALVARQDADGLWRSRTYGALREGLGVTPSVLKAVLFAGEEEAARRGLDALAACVAQDGTVDGGGYPVYTAALATIALTRAGTEADLAARDAWLELLASHQLDEELGWSPEDEAYGGWGYSPRPPEKRAGGSGLDADLSSTLFALGALRVAGVPVDDPRVAKARRFVLRCQNLPLDLDGGAALDPLLDDGGFFFTPTNALQNKAGLAGVDARGRTRYRSYGSMTADGLRALLRCGFEPDHPRVVAARRWLERSFDPERNPGDYDAVREVERRSSYYYACWSQAHALFLVDPAGEGELDWARPLAEAMLARQRPDGTWSNPAGAVMEDDPLVATPFALAVLGLCRMALAREAPRGCPVDRRRSPERTSGRGPATASAAVARTRRGPASGRRRARGRTASRPRAPRSGRRRRSGRSR